MGKRTLWRLVGLGAEILHEKRPHKALCEHVVWWAVDPCDRSTIVDLHGSVWLLLSLAEHYRVLLVRSSPRFFPLFSFLSCPLGIAPAAVGSCMWHRQPHVRK